jgi:Methyltransferase domain
MDSSLPSPFQRTTAAALGFAPPGHFYSPHPRLEDLESHHASILQASRRTDGICLNEEEQLQLLARVATLQAAGPWSTAAEPSQRYYYDNHFYRFGDANSIWHIAQLYRPRRVIEVGGGHTTACWLDTADALNLATKFICIEPYPERVHQLCRASDLANRIELRIQPVQETPSDIFQELGAGDVLFIDSTHVSKCGSDVNHLFFHVLPALAAGVLVHVHDIFWPFDYPLAWYREGRAWNESFLLRAFLQFNSTFRIVRFNSYLAQQHSDVLAKFDSRFISDAGGSIWLRKTN